MHVATDETFLVTGSKGCIGAWTIRLLLDEGTPVVALDLDADPGRLRLLASDEEIEQVRRVAVDITARSDPGRGDRAAKPETGSAGVARVVADEGITHIVHLAALQVPFCQANPVLGAQVNVVGTVNIFEAALAHRQQVRGLTYASSVAAFGPPDLYPGGLVADDSPLAPTTFYGVYKQANEWTAKIYAEAHGLGSVGLRPFVVYGPGRDQGRTSTPTVAMVAAVEGRPYRINFGGHSVFQYAEDVARIFIRAARAPVEQAFALNIGGPSVSMAHVVEAIEAALPEAKGLITFDDTPLPFAGRVDSSGLDRLLGSVTLTSIDEGVRRSIEDFRDLVARGLVSVPEA